MKKRMKKRVDMQGFGVLANLFSTQAIQNGKRMPSPTDGYHGCY